MTAPSPLLSTIAETRSMRLIKVLMLLTSAELPTYAKEKNIDGYGSTREEAIADFMANAVCEDRVSPAEALRLIDEATNA